MRVLLYTNLERDPGMATTFKVADILFQSGCEVLVPPSRRGYRLPETVRVAGEDDTAFDLIISLGGDGTILSIAPFAAMLDIPILGINLGHLGFMTEIECDELNLLCKAASGDFKIEHRMRLDAMVFRNGVCVYESDALNDAVVAKGEISRMIPVTIDSDGCVISSLTCDGVIVATPTGSTAYSMSAGGPIVEPAACNFIVTPICAHTYYGGSIILSSERVIHITLGELEKRSAYLSIDGADSFRLESFDCVKMTVSRYRTSLVRLKDRSFYDILKEKLSNV